MIFQDFSLFPNLTVAENIAMTAERATGTRLVHRKRARDRATEVLERVGVALDLDARVETLPVAHKQLVAICRALASDARLIIMDEPTTALTEREVARLLDLIRRLKADGVAVLFVSHKLAEVLEVCEHVVVLRNGEKVADGPAEDFDAASLTRAMTGRDVAETPPGTLDAAAPILLDVRGLSKAGAFRDVSLTLRAGEVLGVAGLLGSGRTSLAKALFGLAEPDDGTIALDGEPVPLGDPIAASGVGIGYVPEDRLTEGLFLEQSIARNVAVGRFDDHATNGVLNLKSLWGEAAEWLRRLSVKAPDPEGPGPLALGRQPATGRPGPLDGAPAARLDPERAVRGRRRGLQGRDPRHHRRPGGPGPGRHRDLRRSAGTAGYLPPDPGDEGRRPHRRGAGRRRYHRGRPEPQAGLVTDRAR